LLDDYTKLPSKELKGHTRAVREISYSEKNKILISVGFDFEVFIWNPRLSEKIMKLKGHKHPLVGVNVISQLNCFITADTEGQVRVWSILDYSCI
jgi:WD40 repeat protein